MKTTDNENVLSQCILLHIFLKTKIQIHNPFCLLASVPSTSKIINRSGFFEGKDKMNHFYHLGVHTYFSDFKNSQIQNTSSKKCSQKGNTEMCFIYTTSSCFSKHNLEDEIVDTSQVYFLCCTYTF